MKIFRAVVAATAALFLAAPAMAVQYHCQLSEHGSSNFIPREVLVDYQPGGQVRIIDPLIQHYKGAPIAGRVAVDNDRRVTFSWSLKGLKGQTNTGGTTTLPGISYRLTIQKGSLAATISSVLAGYDNRPSGSGGCQRRN